MHNNWIWIVFCRYTQMDS